MTSPAAPVVQAVEPAGDRFAAVQAVADAILYEGYLLYPYRRSARKNQVRWQFGVLAPRPWIEHQGVPDPGVAGAAESWYLRCDCLLEGRPAVTIRVRFLQLVRRQVFRADTPVDRLDAGGSSYVSFDEAVPHDVDVTVAVDDLPGSFPVVAPASQSTELVPGGSVRRCSETLTAVLLVSAEPAPAPFPLTRLTVRVENRVRTADPAGPRSDVLRFCLLATHVLLAAPGRFVSLLDPPAWAAAAAAECRQEHAFPVLAGADPRRHRSEAVLCSPILLYDHPAVAPESPGDLHDAAEIDEILSLRTMTLTEDEKREARATDARAAAIVDRVDSMPPELLAKLHGAVRDLKPRRVDPNEDVPWWDPRAESVPLPDTVLVGSVPVGRGSRVRLRPRHRGTDAQDMFLSGRSAQVQAVLHDVDGFVLVAVTVDDDPAADLLDWYGRYFQFPPEELEPLP